MTAGDMIRPRSRTPLTRELLRVHALEARRPANKQAAILFLGLTFVWVAVLWMAIFGSRPHTYFLILMGTYTVGVLSGTGLSGLVFRRNSRIEKPASRASSEPIDAEVHPVR